MSQLKKEIMQLWIWQKLICLDFGYLWKTVWSTVVQQHKLVILYKNVELVDGVPSALLIVGDTF